MGDDTVETGAPKMLLSGTHRLIRELGRGGMGIVYEAWDTRLERRVAVKMLHPYLFSDRLVGDRLLQEARLAARIEHPNVIRIYGVELIEGGLAIEMQFAEGGSLPVVLAGGVLAGPQVADLLDQILNALAACHAQGVIHCDLKPGNLLISAGGQIVLSDFGIARALSSTEGTGSLSMGTSAPLWGTPQYAPPEAWHDVEPVPSWDLYAAGVLAYEILIGRPPFQGRTPLAVMLEKQSKVLPSIADTCPGLSPEFAALIDALCAHDPALRPSTAKQARELLQKTHEFQLRNAGTALLCATPQTANVDIRNTTHPHAWPAVTQDAQGNVPQSDGPMESGRRRIVLVAGIVSSVLAMVAIAGLALRPAPPAIPGMSLPVVAATRFDEVTDLVVSRDRTFFSYDDGVHGRELWCADSDGEPWMVGDLNPGPLSSTPGHFLNRGEDAVVFAATTAEFGEELWWCNANELDPKIRLIKDIIPGPMGSEPRPRANWEQFVLFLARTLGEGQEYWCTTTREAQTGMVADLCTGPCDYGEMGLLCSDDHVYLRGNHSDGMGLDQYSFTSNSVKHLALVDSGNMAAMGGKVYLDQKNAQYGRELWVLDPADESMTLLKDIVPGAGSSDPSELYAWEGIVYFSAYTEMLGRVLWRTDGTEAGTRPLGDAAGRLPSDPFRYTPVADNLLFTAEDPRTGRELYRLHNGKVGLLADIWPGPTSSVPYNFSANGNYLYFSADDGVHGEELWRIDVTQTSPTPELVVDLRAGKESSAPTLLRWISPQQGYFVAEGVPESRRVHRIRVEGDTVAVTELKLPGPRGPVAP